MKASTNSPLLSIYDGRSCVGFVLARGKRGYESFDAAGEQSLGLFEKQADAIDACIKTKAPAG
jgi:hypothetical protein